MAKRNWHPAPMPVPLLDLGEQHRTLAASIRDQVNDVLRTNRFILGPKVEEFEHAICRYTGVQFAIGVSSGTDALLAILMALGIGRGDAVVTTPYSFFATAGCIARVGATPLFVDIDPETFNLSPRALEEFLRLKCARTSVDTTYHIKKIRAIMPGHLLAMCCQMDEIHTLAET